jgi:hypothetical protein
MAEEAKEKKSKRRDLAGILIPAGLFIGMGVGFATDNLVSGMFIGLGTGFFLFALVYIFVRE